MAGKDTEESGPSRIQQFVTIVAMLLTIIVVALGAALSLSGSISDNRHSLQDQCEAIIQLDRNLRFYEQAIAKEQDIQPPPELNITCS